MSQQDLSRSVLKLVKEARKASIKMASVKTSVKNEGLRRMARALLSKSGYLLNANQKDLLAARAQGLSTALIDRLTLSEARIQSMAQGLRDMVALKDPVGEIIDQWTRPNGLIIKKERVPMGVVGIIYESRPNVTSDCIGLCLKSGNAVILKGGKESFHSNRSIYSVLRDSLKGSSIPREAIQMVLSTSRDAVTLLLQQENYVDLIVPRGGEGLIRFVAEHSHIPVVKHYKGVCHTYVAKDADLKVARDVCFNAKVQRPGVCNAMETMLVDQGCAAKFLPGMLEAFQKAGVEVRGCSLTRKIYPHGVRAAAQQDWPEEYLDLILAVKVVKDVGEAIDHINTYGSKHSDAIITRNKKEAERFLREVDSACVYANTSTRFTDGFEFGLGAEVGISTDKLHVRGPMALEGLTTYKYKIYGKGQVRS